MCRLSLNEKWIRCISSISNVLVTELSKYNTLSNPLFMCICLLAYHQETTQGAVIPVTLAVNIMCIITWYVPPAGVVELAAEVLAESWQIWLSVWHFLRVQRVEQHLGVGGAPSTFDLLQEMSTFCVVGGENLETTHNKVDDGLKWWVVKVYLLIHIAQANQQTCIRLVFGDVNIVNITQWSTESLGCGVSF